MQEIDGYNVLREETTPYLNGDIVVGRHKACNEMILESLYRPLCGVTSMKMQWDELEELVFVVNEVFEDLKTFIVENV